MVKYAFDQSDYRILELTISQVKIDESGWFLACRYKSRMFGDQRVRWFVSFKLDLVKTALGQSNFEILKSDRSQEQQGQSAWFFACCDRVKEDKNCFENL